MDRTRRVPKLGVRFDCVGWGGEEEGYAAVCAHDGYTTITMLAECVLGYQMRAKLKSAGSVILQQGACTYVVQAQRRLK